MRNSIDAIRSLKKYAALALGSDWEVRLTGEEGAFKRPFCRVGESTPGTEQHIGARLIEKRQTFNLLCYPVEKSKPEEAKIEANRVRDLLSTAFSVGVHTASMVPGRLRAHPKRIPLYDYDGIALNAAAAEGDRATNDFMRVTGNPTFTPVPDPEDELIWVVTSDITLWWTKSIVPPYDPNLVTEVIVGGGPGSP
jgi:hypothetical protein